jgi:hypothetical protein
MDKPVNHKAWFFVLPVFLLVAFNAILPLMTVVNYSLQDSFGNNQFFWNGIGWFKELLDPKSQLGERFFDALWRNALFSAIILAIEVPLGIAVALSMPKKGWAVAPTGLCPLGYRPARLRAERHRLQLQLHQWRDRGLGHHHRHGCLALDEPRGAAVLRRPPVYPRRFLSGRAHRRGLALGGVQHHRTAEDAPRPADRRAAAVHGQFHDLH